MIYPSETLQAINWQNPLNQNLVGLFVWNGTTFVDLVSGATATNSPTAIAGVLQDNADFSFSDLNFKFAPDETLSMQFVGTLNNVNTGGQITLLNMTPTADGSGTHYLLFSSGGQWGYLAPILKGNYDQTIGISQLPQGSHFNTVGVSNIKRSSSNNTLFGIPDIYAEGVLGSNGSETQIGAVDAFQLFRLSGELSLVAVWSGTRTLEQFNEVDANPFQLLETVYDRDEYYLQGSTTLNPNVTFDNIRALAGEDFTLRIRYKVDATGFSHLIAGSTSDDYIFAQNGLRIKLGGADNNTLAYTPNGGEVGVWYTLELKRTGTNLVGWLDGVEVYNETTSTGAVTLYRAMYADVYNCRYSLSSIEFINEADSTYNRYWDFNQTSGTQVVDYYNGAVATLNNFPTDSGYVYEGGECVGYEANDVVKFKAPALTDADNITFIHEFTTPPDPSTISADYLSAPWVDSTSRGLMFRLPTQFALYLSNQLKIVTIPFTIQGSTRYKVAFKLTATTFEVLVDDVSLGAPIDITGLRIPFNTAGYWMSSRAQLQASCGEFIHHRVQVIYEDDATLNRNYDFTLGDDDKIIETINGQHAIMENPKTSGWMPVETVDVWTLGTSGKDYSLYSVFVSDTKALLSKQRGYVYDKITQAGNVYHYDGSYKGGLELIGASGNEWSLLNNDTCAYIDVTKIFTYNGEVSLKNIRVNDLASSVIFSENSRIKGLALTTVNANAVSSRIKDSHMSGFTFQNLAPPAELMNNIITGRVVQYSGTMHMTDCILTYTGDNHLWQGTYSAATNLTNVKIRRNQSLAAVNSVNSQTNLTEIDTWFDVNGQLTQTAQTVLAGQGWNGSNICEWAYATVGGTIEVTKDFVFSVDVIGRVAKDFVINTDVRQQVSKDFTLAVSALQALVKDFIIATEFLQNLVVVKNFIIAVDVMERVTKDHIIAAELLQQIVKNHSISISALQHVTKNFTLSLSALQREIVDHVIATDFRMQVSKDFTFSVEVLSQLGVVKDFVLSVDFRQQITKDFTIAAQLLQRVGFDYTIAVSALQALVKDFEIRTNVNAGVVKDFVLSVDTIQQISKDFIISVTLAAETTSAEYVISVDRSIGFSKENIDIEFKKLTKNLRI